MAMALHQPPAWLIKEILCLKAFGTLWHFLITAVRKICSKGSLAQSHGPKRKRDIIKCPSTSDSQSYSVPLPIGVTVVVYASGDICVYFKIHSFSVLRGTMNRNYFVTEGPHSLAQNIFFPDCLCETADACCSFAEVNCCCGISLSLGDGNTPFLALHRKGRIIRESCLIYVRCRLRMTNSCCSPHQWTEM